MVLDRLEQLTFSTATPMNCNAPRVFLLKEDSGSGYDTSAFQSKRFGAPNVRRNRPLFWTARSVHISWSLSCWVATTFQGIYGRSKCSAVNAWLSLSPTHPRLMFQHPTLIFRVVPTFVKERSQVYTLSLKCSDVNYSLVNIMLEPPLKGTVRL
jgi:hypothetical protein